MAFKFDLVSPERLIFSGDVEAVIAPGTEGEFTVLENHAPFMSTLKPGVVTVETTAAARQRLFVSGGFADVAPTGLTILAEQVIPLEELDAAMLDADIADARDDAAEAQGDEAKRLADERLAQFLEIRASFGL
jgi:F-type H+-transporting ATPase subunit epsilon